MYIKWGAANHTHHRLKDLDLYMFLQRLARVSGAVSIRRTIFRGNHTPKQTPALDEVYKVSHNIVRNMTEMELTKMLNVYCGSEFLDYFGQVHVSFKIIEQFNGKKDLNFRMFCRRDIWT